MIGYNIGYDDIVPLMRCMLNESVPETNNIRGQFAPNILCLITGNESGACDCSKESFLVLQKRHECYPPLRLSRSEDTSTVKVKFTLDHKVK